MFFILENPIYLILTGIGLAGFVFLAWRRFDLGLAIVLFLAPLYLLKINIAGLPLTVLELLILIVFAVWLIKTKFRYIEISKYRNIFLPVLLILAGVFISTLLSADIKTSAGIFKSWFVEPIIFGLILIDTVKTKKQAGKLLLALLLSGTAVATLSLAYLPGVQLTFDGRLRAFYLSPNHLAMYLAPAILICLGFLFQSENKKRRKMAAWCLAPLTISFYFTFSYAAWLGVLLALLVFLFSLGKWEGVKTKKLLITCLIILVVLVAVLGYLQWQSPKLNDLLYSSRSSLQSRLMIWRSSWEILKTHWLFGIGAGLFQKYYLEYQKYFPPYLEWAVPQPHNLFLAWWLQTGLLGLIGFIWLLVNFFRNIFKNPLLISPFKRGSSEGVEPLILILTAVIIYTLAHGLVDTTYWKNDLSLIFWAIISLSYTIVHRRD